MNENLRILKEIQNIDDQIYKIYSNAKTYPTTIDHLKHLIQIEKRKLEQIHEEIQKYETKKKDCETEIVQSKESLSKSLSRVEKITNNREYDAVHHEIAGFKDKIARNEDLFLKIVMKIEDLHKSKAEQEKNWQATEQKNQSEIQIIEEQAKQVEQKLSQRQTARKELCDKIPKPFLREYESIKKRRKEKPVIGLVDNKRRACGFCNGRFNPQRFIEIRNADKIIFCDSCGSIIIFDDSIDTKEPELIETTPPATGDAPTNG